MDFDSWVFTIALTLCALAIAVYEPREPRRCEQIYHEAKHLCTTYDGDRVRHHTN